MEGIIYKVQNIENGKVYIGQTTCGLKHRMNEHIKDAKTDYCNLFHNAIQQYGKDSFIWEVIDTFNGSDDSVLHQLNVAEEYWILKYRSNNIDYGYNSTQGGYSSNKFSNQVLSRMKDQPQAAHILQYDINGVFKAEFSSLCDVCRHLDIAKIKATELCSGLHYNHQWRVKKDDNFPKRISPYIANNTSAKECLCYNTKTGMLVGIFASIKEASIKLSVSTNTIATQIKNNNTFSVSYKESNMPKYTFFAMTDNYPMNIEVDIIPQKIKGTKKAPHAILQYDLEGNFVKEYNSMQTAHYETLCSVDSIKNQLIKNEPIQIYHSTKYLWRYKDDNFKSKIEVIPVKHFVRQSHKTKEHRVVQCTWNGEIIQVWESIAKAVENNVGDTYGLIRNCCKGKQSNALRYRWIYYQDYFK